MKQQEQKQDVVWLQLSAGQGPRECGWVVTRVLNYLLADATKKGLSIELAERLAFDKHLRKQNLVECDAYLSALLRLEGLGALTYAQTWAGSIKWQGTSPYRPKHKRCNWFVGVELVSVNQVKPLELQQLLKEVDIEATRASKPGGQHVNKTSSAVRITHRPTGIQVRNESARSQHRNRQLALERLQWLLAAGNQAKDKALVRERWLKHYQVERGKPVRVFKGEEFTASG